MILCKCSKPSDPSSALTVMSSKRKLRFWGPSGDTMEWFREWSSNIKWRNSPAHPNEAYVPTAIEHVANIITHGVWVMPSIWASAELLSRSDTWPHVLSSLVYGAALVLVFTMSTFFHTVHYCCHNRPLKDVLHRTDRAMIYVFIAASYFPWLMLGPVANEGVAAQLWWLIWVLALLGILYQQLFHERYKTLETLFYCFMAIAPASPIIAKGDFQGLNELKMGGFVYMIGVVFFKSDGSIPCAHAIWHLMVALAAGTHYYAIQKYLFPPGNTASVE